ncbi:MAG: energy transducer TonB family protein [Bacteroidota bacterium]
MNANIRSRSMILSVAVHAGLFLVLLFTMLKTQIPPFPETGGSGGVIVNIGTVDEASGDVQPMAEVISKDPVIQKVPPATAPEEDIATQDLEEVNIPPAKKVDVKKDVKPTKTEVKNTTKPAEPVKTVNPSAIYQGKTTASKSQGTGSGSGDQGDKNGDPFSKYTGKNGNGTGTGGGEGTGIGNGTGKGISFSLSGRKLIRTPQITDHSQETGKVVVDITVDKDGNVETAIPGGRGSTTTSAYLFRLAKEAAMKAKFNPSPEGADIQKGTISFVFLVQ